MANYHELTLRIEGDPVLRQVAEPWNFQVDAWEDVIMLARTMFHIMYENDGIGLAAPQVGVSKRLVVMHLPEKQPRVFINPEVASYPNIDKLAPLAIEEGCLSVPGVTKRIYRAPVVWVHHLAMTPDGPKQVQEVLERLDAVCIQHEVDHLNGILISDKEEFGASV